MTANGTSDEFDINAAPSGYRYATVTDASGAGIDVEPTAVRARNSTGAHANAATSAAPVAPSFGGTSADSAVATDRFDANGSQKVGTSAGGQTFASSFFDTFNNGGAPASSFVFDPGFGRDVVDLFRVDGADHDTLSFKGADYGNDIATVLAGAKNTSAGLLITDPTTSSPGGGPGTHDTPLLEGITNQQLAANRGDIAFHA